MKNQIHPDFLPLTGEERITVMMDVLIHKEDAGPEPMCKDFEDRKAWRRAKVAHWHAQICESAFDLKDKLQDLGLNTGARFAPSPLHVTGSKCDFAKALELDQVLRIYPDGPVELIHPAKPLQEKEL